MDLLQLFRRTLSVPYRETESAASYYFEQVGGELRLFFEKSNGAADWKNNLDFPAVAYREAEDRWFLHRGFLRVFRSLKEPLKAAICGNGVEKVLISGYSHGAALALLAHEYCAFHRPDLAGAIRGFGFGCPRVVWGPLPARVKARFAHFTVVRNCRDLITHLPPALLFYRHVGAVLHVGRGEAWGPIDSHRPECYERALSEEAGDGLDV